MHQFFLDRLVGDQYKGPGEHNAAPALDCVLGYRPYILEEAVRFLAADMKLLASLQPVLRPRTRESAGQLRKIDKAKEATAAIRTTLLLEGSERGMLHRVKQGGKKTSVLRWRLSPAADQLISK